MDDREDQRRRAARRFTLPEREKARRLGSVKGRLTVNARPPADAPSSGWLGPALFWTAFFALGSVAASHWLSASRGSTAVEVHNGAALELGLGRSGHYEVAGWVASEPTRFIVDTGASLTSIPHSLGERIGNAGNEKIRDYARENASRTDADQISILNSADRRLVSRWLFRA